MFTLTDRQSEIAELLLAGVSCPTAIGRRLEVGQPQVRYHLQQMRIVTGARDNDELIELLRAARESPVDRLLEQCRREPRAWFQV